MILPGPSVSPPTAVSPASAPSAAAVVLSSLVRPVVFRCDRPGFIRVNAAVNGRLVILAWPLLDVASTIFRSNLRFSRRGGSGAGRSGVGRLCPVGLLFCQLISLIARKFVGCVRLRP